MTGKIEESHKWVGIILLFGFDLQLDPGLSNLEPSGSELYLLLKFFKRGEGWSRKWSSSCCF